MLAAGVAGVLPLVHDRAEVARLHADHQVCRKVESASTSVVIRVMIRPVNSRS
ncbi:hypothetical protein SALBM311S_01621 [Streptomyces alboniger]